jgi:hypothetical protein
MNKTSGTNIVLDSQNPDQKPIFTLSVVVCDFFLDIASSSDPK